MLHLAVVANEVYQYTMTAHVGIHVNSDNRIFFFVVVDHETNPTFIPLYSTFLTPADYDWTAVYNSHRKLSASLQLIWGYATGYKTVRLVHFVHITESLYAWTFRECYIF